jgi:F-type H+-transporting ATPase subunit g
MAKLLNSLPKLTVDFARPRLNTFWRYAKVELKPPTPGEFGEIGKGISNIVNGASSGKWAKVTVKVYL